MNLHPRSKLDYHYIADGVFIGTDQCCQTRFDKVLLAKGISVDISLEKTELDTPLG